MVIRWPSVRVVLVLSCASLGCGRIGFDPGGGAGSTPDAGPDATNGAGADAGASSNIMFVTRDAYAPGSLGSLQAADGVCQAEAAEAGLAGTFVAWLSTSQVNAIDRLGSARGWIRADGEPFVDLSTDLLAPKILTTPSVDANGDDQALSANPFVATGTRGDGTADIKTCGDLSDPQDTIMQGDLNVAASLFTGYVATATCAGGARLYCFGIDRAAPLVVRQIAARRAFLSEPWTPGLGLAGADAHCQGEADAAGIGGSYFALLATSAASAASRAPAGLPWARIDGVPIVRAASDLSTGTFLHPLHVDVNGVHHQARVLVGANNLASPANNACNDWTSASAGVVGTRLLAESPQNSVQFTPCSVPARLYCLEQ